MVCESNLRTVAKWTITIPSLRKRLSNIHWLTPDEHSDWDAFVTGHPLAHVYHLSSWQKVLETAFQHIRGRILVLRDGSGQIQAGLPVYRVSSWLLGNRTVSVPFATMCDPLISSKEDLEVLWPAILDASKKHKSRRIEIRTRHTSAQMMPSPLAPAARFKHHYLPLNQAPEVLFRSFDKTTIRQRIDKARRADVTIEQREDEEALKALYDILVDTRRRRSLPPMPYGLFHAMYHTLAPGRAVLYLAKRQGNPVGGLIVLKFNGLWTAEYSGVAQNETPGIGPLLFWESIQAAIRDGASNYSFGRTSLTNKGLLDHKRRWATIEEDLTDFVSCSRAKPDPARQSDGLAPYQAGVRLLMRYTPGPVQKLIGDFAYRHLG
jgi:hypothetical protein